MGHCTELHEDEVVYCTVNLELERLNLYLRWHYPHFIPLIASRAREESSTQSEKTYGSDALIDEGEVDSARLIRKLSPSPGSSDRAFSGPGVLIVKGNLLPHETN